MKKLKEHLENCKRDMSFDDYVNEINKLREIIHKHSPFNNEPTDFVQWVKSEEVEGNDYNPNSVAPPEMELLKLSIMEDGYTQPVVTFKRPDIREVVDGFHRNRVGKEDIDIKTRIHGYLPVVTINSARTKRADRIAATVRHNRARGKHSVEGMSTLVIDLKKRNWKDSKIAKHLGMDEDEVLRLQQISGLASNFADQTFSKAWEPVETDE